MSRLVLWAPTWGDSSHGRPQSTYVNTLCRDSGLRREELRTAVEDNMFGGPPSDVWRAAI